MTEMPKPNSNRSHQIQELVDKVTPTLPPPTWMSDELLNELRSSFEAMRTIMLMNMTRMGLITQEQAQEVTPEQLFIVAFNLGLAVGEELEQTNAFRRMMGEDI